ncbi:MAG TPA: phosphate ABC transporter permease subunit PstC [Actinomycetota bacterium]|jgi:phosphate transport system permease protein|nr:phosphate ABC transporter permease subunit PstC [Actinomycetota bacterium]
MSVTATTRRPITLELMGGSKRRHRKERVVRALFLAAAVLGLVISLAIVLALVEEAVRWLFAIDVGWLWAEGWFPRADEFDLLTILSGTVMIAVIAMLVATPIGLGAAAYLSEYATPRTRRTLKPILETLASIPSVVLGYFALQVINPDLVRKLFSSASTFNYLAAGLAVGILTIPLVASVAEDAMHAVPSALREAAFGIGARRKTVTTRVVFPAAVSGIVASLILGFSRAVGETMVVAIAAGATGGASRTFNPLDGGQTMTGAISSLAIGSDQVRGSGFAFDALYFVGLMLFVLTFLLNVVSERFVRRVRSKY